MIYPPRLMPGDCVGIVAPGKKLKKEAVEASVTILTGFGLQVKLGTHLFSEKHHYLAGTDSERLSDMQSMLHDPMVKAILCARGGYGSTRIIDNLTMDGLRANPKWIVGFSDITAIHLKSVRAEVASIHGLMPILFSDSKYASSLLSLQRALFNGEAALHAKGHGLNRSGQVSATVVGGNLSLLADSLGTKTEIETRGRILILEEVDEYRYRVDRMITQLKRAGKFEHLAGLVIGHFTDIKETESGFGDSEETIIMNAVKDYSYPIGFGFPTGHDNPNEAWIHGGEATLNVSATASSLVFKQFTSDIV